MKIVILAAALLIASPAFADDAMQKTANAFYAASLPENSGIPDAKALAKIGPTVTPALSALLGQAASAEAAFMSANKNSPPMIEGDLFTSLFEGATAYSVTSCNGDATRAKCDVALTYDDKHNKPTHWTDSALLVNTTQGWRVDDIAYGGSWDFGNKGRADGNPASSFRGGFALTPRLSWATKVSPTQLTLLTSSEEKHWLRYSWAAA